MCLTFYIVVGTDKELQHNCMGNTTVLILRLATKQFEFLQARNQGRSVVTLESFVFIDCLAPKHASAARITASQDHGQHSCYDGSPCIPTL